MRLSSFILAAVLLLAACGPKALERPLGPTLRARAGSGLEAQQRERRRVLGKAAKLGSPVLLPRQYFERFG